MKLLLLNGSPHENGCTATALREVGRTLEALGIETETHWVGREPVPSCIACGGCKKTGTCIYDDGVNRILERSEEWDGLVVGSPCVLWCASGQVISFLDRLFFCLWRAMGGKSCRRSGFLPPGRRVHSVSAAESIFFGMNNLVVATSQYWNQVHGNTPQEVASGGFANHAHPGPQPGLDPPLPGGAALPAPEREPVTPTNFIR